MSRRKPKEIAGCGRGGFPLVAALLLGVLSLLPGAAAAQSGRGGGYPGQSRLAYRRSNVEDQVKRLTKRLELNETQQLEVRRVLVHQREQVARLWNNPAVEPMDRAVALRAIQQNTVKQIRVFLNEEQRKKYMAVPEQPPGDAKSLDDNYRRYVGAR